MIWRIIAKLFGLGLLTVRPSWPEVRYKLRGKVLASRHRRAYARQCEVIERQQCETKTLFKELAERLAAEAKAAPSGHNHAVKR